LNKNKIKEIIVGFVISLCISLYFFYFYGNTRFIQNNQDKNWYLLLGISLLFILPIAILLNYKLMEEKNNG